MRVLAVLLVSVTCGWAQTPREDIAKVLTDQVESWNRGDVEGYMRGYWNSPETKFVSGGNVVMGYDSVLARYKRTYGTREKMGQLGFDELDIRVLDGAHAIVSGRWKLHRASDAPWGRFTLIVRKIRSEWRIVYDHTSTGE